ncbi:MAG TPA: NF038129 family PEP-CTERM protein [Duganella sp.]|jgi:hypothetical protein
MFVTNLSPATLMRRAALALAMAAAAAASSLASAQTLHVELDTSLYSASGNSGWLDLQFNPANLPAVSANALVGNLVGFGADAGAVLTGDVSRQGGGYLFGNSTDYNDMFRTVSFGGKVSFDVTFSGLADPSSAAIPSAFSLALYAADGMTQLGNADANGNLLVFNWIPAASGAGTVNVGYAAAGLAVSAVPEPSTWLMLGAGLALVGGLARRRQTPATALAA